MRLQRIEILSGPGGDVVDPAELGVSLASWTAESKVDVVARELATEAELVVAAAEAGPATVGFVVNAAVGDALREALAGAAPPAVMVSHGLTPDASAGSVSHIRGRGLDGYTWALRHLLAIAAWPPETLAYGPEPDQVGDLRRPVGADRMPVAVLLHGGFWRVKWGRDLMDAVAIDLARRGWATWNVEYRRTGSVGGAWPATLDDVAAAVDVLAGLAESRRLDLTRVATVGHSAGGQLALWLAGRSRSSRVDVRAAVGLAPICDLAAAAAAGLGDGAVHEFTGDAPELRLDRYRQASPSALLPLGVPQLLVHGDRDSKVPVAMSRAYAGAAAAAGDRVELVVVPGADHMAVTDPDSAGWPVVADWLATVL